jgi:hypothetical protein
MLESTLIAESLRVVTTLAGRSASPRAATRHPGTPARLDRLTSAALSLPA